MDKEPKQEEPEVGEDTTQYGEFVILCMDTITKSKRKGKENG